MELLDAEANYPEGEDGRTLPEGVVPTIKIEGPFLPIPMIQTPIFCKMCLWRYQLVRRLGSLEKQVLVSLRYSESSLECMRRNAEW